ncbi:hypothetical protein LD11_gp271 [Bacillus phage Riley]|uniref:Uncharacterized protein n=3 Tax=Bequatrovirus TaxID=1917990 RepID=A0A075M031_9CAUD|nr:hypothetical protein LD11_gp271 [Bacillus phage Riley]YP_009206635.1 hypothetical protein AVV02_gp280 [Bacillus phage AvesoBmore]ASZ76004.1 hypothetical protein TAFFO16_271 [Bacillus phage Taffo16]ULF48897.1 hypothetical protein [Bacillus phage BillyBob]AIF72147.1 hypothetical protein [Bacillus phage Riley]ALA13419.1 hypothetical protein AVESOBMORE_280 [Bacillus phage AvesoBmore]
MTKLETLINGGTVTIEKFRTLDNFLDECEHNDLEVEVGRDEDNFYTVTLKK